MKKFLFVLFLTTCSVQSQIVSAEYFIDTDPGFGNGTSLTVSGNEINQDFNIPTNGLTAGVHKLYVRVLNTDNTWSLYGKNVFYLSENNSNSVSISAAEYFIDTDPGFGNGTSLTVSGNEINQDFNIPTTGLTAGVHKLYVRVLNTDNTWSLYGKNLFYLSENNSNTSLITSAEYFFDIDPGFGNATAVDLNEVENLDEDLVFQTPNDLADGDHILYIRVQNTDGAWSLYAQAETISTLGLSDFELNNFKLYPNPVEDILHLDTNGQTITSFKIINLNGQVVFQKNNVSEKVNLSFLNSGAYLIHLTTETARISKKIIKK